MRLFRMEFYKIAARPAMGVVFLLMAAFFLLVFYQEARSEEHTSELQSPS